MGKLNMPYYKMRLSRRKITLVRTSLAHYEKVMLSPNRTEDDQEDLLDRRDNAWRMQWVQREMGDMNWARCGEETVVSCLGKQDDDPNGFHSWGLRYFTLLEQRNEDIEVSLDALTFGIMVGAVDLY